MPTATLSPSLTSTSMAGMLPASTFGPTMMQPVSGLQTLVAGGVVAVVMGDEDVGERPALFVERREHRIGVGSVDRGRGPGFRIVNQHAVIVAARRKLVNFKLCHYVLPPSVIP